MKCYQANVFQKLDEEAIKQGISAQTLMGNAVKGVYEVLSDKGLCKRVLIVCGSGNNGGDGLALASLYHDAFEEVKVLYVASKKPHTEAARYFYGECEKLGILACDDVSYMEANVARYDVIVDALFGTGLSRDIQAPYLAIIEAINQSGCKVVSIDMPSGIDSDYGRIMGKAIHADITVTFEAGKVGQVLYPGYEYTGEVIVKAIGIPHDLLASAHSTITIIDETDLKKRLPRRMAHSHKGTYGKVLGIGGDQTMGGAILMAGEAVLRSGAGTCTLALPETIQSHVCAYLPELMSIPLPQVGTSLSETALHWIDAHLHEYNVVFCGCGGGREPIMEDVVTHVLASNQPCVIDGDGLYALRHQRSLLVKHEHIIVTPHLKEMTYLIDMSVDEIIKDPLRAADCFVSQYPNVVLVLKSERPLIAYQKQRFLSTQGNHALAKGGSGDVLCGLIASQYAQTKDALQGAILGCGLHALCAKQAIQHHSAQTILPHELCQSLDEVFANLT